MNALPLAASRELRPAVGGLTLRKFPRTLNVPVQRGILTRRPGELGDPSVSAIALIAAARIHVFGTVADAFFNDQRQGLIWVPAFAGTTAERYLHVIPGQPAGLNPESRSY